MKAAVLYGIGALKVVIKP